MKKLLLSLVMFLSCFTMATAQFYAGGSLGISHSKLDFGNHDQSGTSFKILPEVGYQFNDRWSFGLNLGFMKGYAALGSFDPSDLKALGNAIISTAADVSSDDMMDLDLKTFRIAPYARYALIKGKRFELFLDGSFAFNLVKADAEADLGSNGTVEVDDQKLKGFEICIRPGVSYAVTDHVKLIAKIGSLGYQQFKLDDHDLKLTRFGLDVDSSNLLFGLLYAF